MSRQKLQRFAHNIEAANVIERGKPLYTEIKGKWRDVYFQNQNPVVLELACGKGEYTIGLASVYPDKNFIGIDIKGERIARGSKRAIDQGLGNVAFLRTGIQYLEEFFEENEIDEIWLIHPDPQPKDRDEKKRLTNPDFLKSYSRFLKKEGLFRLKTDNPFLYEYSLEKLNESAEYEVIGYSNDLYESELNEENHGIFTHYEKVFTEKGFSINFIKCICKK